MSVYIATGVTSSLIQLFVTVFRIKVYATAHGNPEKAHIVEHLKELGVEFVTREQGLRLPFEGKCDRFIWASTHSDHQHMQELTSIFSHGLIIGTAAMTAKIFNPSLDKFYGSEKWNMWQSVRDTGKVTLIMPGFFIEDVATHSKGLHTDTSRCLFNNQWVAENTLDKNPAWWNKPPYSVTPISSLLELLKSWASNPVKYSREQALLACSDGQFTRTELRRFVDKEPVIISDNYAIYAAIPHAMHISIYDVMIACDKAHDIFN